MSFTTEEIYQLVSKSKKSIHLEKFLNFPKQFENTKLYEKWLKLILIRDTCNLSIEEKRASKEIGSSLEAHLKIQLSEKLKILSENTDFSELCIVSKAEVTYKGDIETTVITSKAKGSKCPICWKIKETACDRSNCAVN